MTTSEVGIVKAWHEALNETATSIAWWALSPLAWRWVVLAEPAAACSYSASGSCRDKP